ncbi:hypothetical protein DFH11DRAFT_1731698 [Phellopilus nigrolimitatus]|nr:hypothetical protein DFH11DRAFT_1731698 [Phellopilus nigrolimitatus]
MPRNLRASTPPARHAAGACVEKAMGKEEPKADKRPRRAAASPTQRLRGDGAPEERTSTLVLTSPTQLFVDLRILTDADTSALRQGSSAIDWAFAGLWAHWVDSRTDTPAAVRDAGTCEPLPDGDTLERGEMPNAAGVRERYEEVWRDDPHAGRARAAVYVCLRRADLEDLGSADGVDGGVGGVAAVDPARVCGMVVRVGAWCQGVLKENWRDLLRSAGGSWATETGTAPGTVSSSRARARCPVRLRGRNTQQSRGQLEADAGNFKPPDVSVAPIVPSMPAASGSSSSSKLPQLPRLVGDASPAAAQLCSCGIFVSTRGLLISQNTAKKARYADLFFRISSLGSFFDPVRLLYNLSWLLESTCCTKSMQHNTNSSSLPSPISTYTNMTGSAPKTSILMTAGMFKSITGLPFNAGADPALERGAVRYYPVTPPSRRVSNAG